MLLLFLASCRILQRRVVCVLKVLYFSDVRPFPPSLMDLSKVPYVVAVRLSNNRKHCNLNPYINVIIFLLCRLFQES